MPATWIHLSRARSAGEYPALAKNSSISGNALRFGSPPVLECVLKLATTLACYIATSVIAIFILPNKFIGMAFFVLFGNYPIIKLYIEKTKNIIVECVVKFAVANIYLIAVYVILRALESYSIFDFNIYLLYFVGIILLLFYDLTFSFVINAFYKSYYKFLK